MTYKLWKALFIALVMSIPGIAQTSGGAIWHSWNTEKTLKILNDSAWASQWSTMDTALSYNSLNASVADRGPSLAPAPPIILRVYSALTLRMALLRVQEISAKYDKLDSSGKSQFDEKNKSMLYCSNCGSYYVFVLMQPVERGSRSVVADRFRDETLDTLKGKVFLENEKKERIYLEHFVAPKGNSDPAVFYFPRSTTFATDEIKKFTFVFKKTLFKDKAFMENASFDLKKMVVDGKVDL